MYVPRGTGTLVGFPLLPMFVSADNTGSEADGSTITDVVWKIGVFRRSTLTQHQNQ